MMKQSFNLGHLRFPGADDCVLEVNRKMYPIQDGCDVKAQGGSEFAAAPSVRHKLERTLDGPEARATFSSTSCAMRE